MNKVLPWEHFENLYKVQKAASECINELATLFTYIMLWIFVGINRPK